MPNMLILSKAQHNTITELLDKVHGTVYHVEDTNVNQALAVHIKGTVYFVDITGSHMKVG